MPDFLERRKADAAVSVQPEPQKKAPLVPAAFNNPMGALFYYHAFGMNPVELIEEVVT
jgi:hypothetical protein